MLPGARLWGIAILGCVSVFPILIGPIIMGILVDYGNFTDSTAGMTAGYGALGSVAVALICALFMHRLPLRKLAVGGLALAMVTNLGAALSHDHLQLFYGIRVLNAVGDGALYAVVMSAFAREQSSERCYGLFMMFQFGLAGIGLWALPTYFPHMTPRDLYLGFAGLQLLVVPLLRLLPAAAADVAGISIRGSEWKLKGEFDIAAKAMDVQNELMNGPSVEENLNYKYNDERKALINFKKNYMIIQRLPLKKVIVC